VTLTLVLVCLSSAFDGSGRAEPEPVEAPVPPEGETTTSTMPPTYVFEAAGRAGFTTAPIRGGVNPFGLGFGGRIGFDFWRLYLGASFMSHLGGSDTVGATDQALLFGLELGYNGRIGRYLTLRPMLGVGDVILSHTEPIVGSADVVTSASGSSSAGALAITTEVKNVYLEPGLAAIFASGHFSSALRVSAVVVPGIIYGAAPAEETTWVSYSVELQLGFRL
jgi:hypothetical protein